MTELTEWDALRVAIETATNLVDVKIFHDKAQALKHYLKASGEAEEVVRRFSELKVRAERKGGELLLVMPKQRPGEWQRRTEDGVASYAELGINDVMASKWQRIASIPARDFEGWLTEVPEITSVAALSFAKKFIAKPATAPKAPVPTEFSGRYAVILADPANTEADLLSLRLKSDDGDKTVQEIAETDALLFFWSKAEGLEDSIKIMSSWGFQYETVAFTWIKRDRDGNPHLGKGDWTAGNVELCLLGKKGVGLPRVGKEVSSILETQVLEEGEKPAELRSRIVALVGEVSRIELFPKHSVKGWDSYSV